MSTYVMAGVVTIMILHALDALCGFIVGWREAKIVNKIRNISGHDFKREAENSTTQKLDKDSDAFALGIIAMLILLLKRHFVIWMIVAMFLRDKLLKNH